MSMETGALIATGVLFAILLNKKKYRTDIIIDPDLPVDHWPDGDLLRDTDATGGQTVTQVATGEPGGGQVIREGILPVYIDYIGVFPVSYSQDRPQQLNGLRRISRGNLGSVGCI